jgi:acetyltransferase-like isoleucine patch superfamily enzyme
MNVKLQLRIRNKILYIQTYLRRYYYSFLGMTIGKNATVGKVLCVWPNGVSIGEDSHIEDKVVFHVKRPYLIENRIEIGKKVFIGHGCEFNCNTTIKIGDNCLIASNTTFVDTGHHISRNANINEQGATIKPIVIEEDVWIGTHCVILQGVTIGKGSVIGACTLVNKSVPPYQIWGGTPARFIKNRE